jgi:hypothetical protein
MVRPYAQASTRSDARAQPESEHASEPANETANETTNETGAARCVKGMRPLCCAYWPIARIVSAFFTEVTPATP